MSFHVRIPICIFCKLSVWEGDTCEYEVDVDISRSLYDWSALSGSLGSLPYIPIETPNGKEPELDISNTNFYVYAFVYNGTNLQIVTPSGPIYTSTGELRTYNIVFVNGELTRTNKVPIS